MKQLLVIGASTHGASINVQLARFAASLVPDSEAQVIDLNDFEMPIYSEDREGADGIPELAKKFVSLIEESDGVVLSLAEHNGSYTAAFKNVLDWASRHQQKLWSEKPMLLLATSPGGRGASTVLAAAEQTFPHLGAQIAVTFSLPSYYDNFEDGKGVLDDELAEKLKEACAKFSDRL